MSEKILELINNEELRIKMGENGRAQEARRRFEKMARHRVAATSQRMCVALLAELPVRCIRRVAAHHRTAHSGRRAPV